MNNTIKGIIILSAIIGGIFSFLALIPVVVKIAVFILMTCISIPIVVYLKRLGILRLTTVKESLIYGSLCGFISFIVFCAIYLPLVYVLSLFLPINYLGGLVLMLKLSNFGLIFMFTIFVSIVSIIFNAFSSLLCYYIFGSITTAENDRFSIENPFAQK